MSTAVKTHYSAAELAAMKLEGIPSSKSSMIELAERESWSRQKRAGRGGGFEYQPPEAIMAQIRSRAASALLQQAAMLPVPKTVQTLPVKSVRREEQLPLPLTDAQQLRESARKGVLLAIEKLMAGCGVGKESAITAVMVEAKKDPAGQMARMLQMAGDERGRKSGDGMPSVRTIKRWFAQDAVGALAPKAKQKDMSVPAWASAFLSIWQAPQKPTVELAYRMFEQEWQGELPSVHQVRRFLAKMGNVSRHAGRMGAKELKTIKPFIRRDVSKFLPNDCWVADGHCFDAEVQHPFTGKPFRPEMTAFLDLRTRRCVGFSVDLAESSLAILAGLLDGIRRYGKPAMLYTDNGAYRARMFTDEAVGVMGRLDISPEFRAPWSSQAGGLSERAHQTIWVRLAKTMPTYVGADMDSDARRKMFKLTRNEVACQPAPTGLMSFENFLKLAHDTVEDYNARPHSALGKKSPDQVWQEYVAQGFTPDFLSDDEAGHLCRPREMRIVQRGEVRIGNNRYFSHALEEFHGESMQVGYDIHDASQVWIYDAEGRFVCTAEFEANKRDYFPMSKVEAAREKRADGRIKRAELKIADAQAERRGRPAIEAPEDIVIPGMVGTIKRSELAQRAEVLEAREIEAAKVVEIDTPQMRFEKWLRIDAALKACEAVSVEEQKYWANYQKSPQWRAFMAQRERTTELQLGGSRV